MSNLSYMVVPAGGTWSLRHEGFAAGRFQSRDTAVDEALKLAREARAVGHAARVVLRELDGSERELWRGRAV